MTDPNLENLGVTAHEVSSVENDILARAEAQADLAETKELESNISRIDEQIEVVLNEKRSLARSSYSTKRSRELEVVGKKLASLRQRRLGLLEADAARRQIRKKSQNLGESIADDCRAEGETEREFLIRTGRLTPFQGQVGYGMVANPTTARRRRITSLRQKYQFVGAQNHKSRTASISTSPIFDEGGNASGDDGSAQELEGINRKSSYKSREEDSDYNPDESFSSTSGEDQIRDQSEQVAKRARKRSRSSSLNDDGADISIPQIDSSEVDSKHVDELLSEKEGDEWEIEAEEEVEVQVGLRVASSIYDRLFDYQKTGVQWLWELHCQETGGILGDEMGLGKTVQIVAFLAALDYSGKLAGSVIVLAPTTLLCQWYREFRTWWPRFRVRILHHSQESGRVAVTKKKRVSRKYDPLAVIEDVTSQSHGVLITSYEQLRKRQEVLLDKFYYVIADEGHKMKSPDADITLICKKFNTPHRIIVSGSPLQNHLKELWSLFDFVYPGKLGTLPVFQEQFVAPITIGAYSTASKAQVHTAYKCSVVLRDLISPYLLRRLKRDVAKQLPEKNEQILFVKLTCLQREKYKKFLKSRFVRQVLSGKLNLLYAITALRKICNHYDISLYNNDNDNEFASIDGLAHTNPKRQRVQLLDQEGKEEIPEDYGNSERSGKMIVLDRILHAWHASGSRVLLFSQTRTMLDILQKFLQTKRYTHLRMDGKTAVGSRMDMIDKFNADESIFVFLLTTRVGGLGINLTGADRVVLFDPDWNPSTDLQARERAWRVGQKKPVTVYRLISTGTIEEKIYHRQIYKQFMTNKVLSDPRQRRFFKPKNIKDLFRLGDEGEEGTETGDLFAGTAAKEVTKSVSHLHSDWDDSTTRDNPGRKPDSAIPDNCNARLLNSLLDDGEDGQLHSAINHDAVLGAGTDGEDCELLEYEADKVAQEAVREISRSSQRRRRQGVSVPTWTGRSGLAGLVRDRAIAGERNGSKATALLRKMKQREEGIGGATAYSQENGLSEKGNILSGVIGFLKSKGGESTSAEVVGRFRNLVGETPEGLQSFKAILKTVAQFVKGAGPEGASVWRLKDEAPEI